MIPPICNDVGSMAMMGILGPEVSSRLIVQSPVTGNTDCQSLVAMIAWMAVTVN